MKKYKVNKIFYTIQGEGPRFGIPQIFVRFSLCNLKCWFCDTEFDTFTEMTAIEILKLSKEIGNECRNVSFCGGEPGIQLSDEIITVFKGWFTSVETNGMYKLPKGIDYVICSPKNKKIIVENVNEFRFVISDGENVDSLYNRVKNKKKDIITLSPCFDGEIANQKNIDYCIKTVMNDPAKFRLSIQSHKFIGVE